MSDALNDDRDNGTPQSLEATPVDASDEESVDDAEDDEYFYEVGGYDKWPRSVAEEFADALRLAMLACLKEGYEVGILRLPGIEAEYLEKLKGSDENMDQVRRHIAEWGFVMATEKNQPFATCLGYWNELVRLGFYRIERKCYAIVRFANSCLKHRETALGLSFVEPLIEELERLLADPIEAEKGGAFYNEHLEWQRKLRADLLA
jgi:hypothetical protein